MANPSHYMGFLIPAFGDPSPGYVTNLSDALTTIDAHDHSPGNGVPIVSEALNINADLPFNTHNATGLRSSRYVNGSLLADVTDANCVFVSGGNLYFNNASGTSVQITTGSSLFISNGIGGDYASTGAQVAYTDATKKYDFWTPGSTVYAALFGAQLYSKSGTPGIAFDDITASAYAFRAGVDANKWQLSIDTAGTRAVAASGHYATLPTGLVLQLNAGVPSLGVGVAPVDAALHVRNPTVNTAGALYTAFFSNTVDQCLVASRGSTTAIGNRSATFQLTDNSRWWNIGMLGTVGAASTGGALGDFTISGPAGQESVFVITAADRRIGIGCAAPLSRVGLSGNAAIGTYADTAAAPTDGLIVSGQSAFGTATPSGSAALTVGGGGLAVSAGGLSVLAGGLAVGAGGLTVSGGHLTLAAANDLILAATSAIVPSVAHSSTVGTLISPFLFMYADQFYGGGPSAYQFPTQSIVYYSSPMHLRSSGGSLTVISTYVSFAANSTGAMPLVLPDAGTITNLSIRYSSTGATPPGYVRMDEKIFAASTSGSPTNLGTMDFALGTDLTLNVGISRAIATNGFYSITINSYAASTLIISGISVTVSTGHVPPSLRM